MMQTTPEPFDSYWQQTLDELAGFPANAEIDLIPLRSTDFATLYGVRLTSPGPYRLFGYLSIPVGEGPFPAIYYTPKYQSVLEIIPQGTAIWQRRRYITFALAARGQRLADTPYMAAFPGLLTDGIENAETYIFRGIVADSVRGLEFLITRDELDASHVVVFGNDMALMTAALHPGATHVVTNPALFYRSAELAPKTQAYPLEEINDYLRAFPDRTEAVHHTLSYYELQAFAPRVQAATLLIAGPNHSLLDGLALEPLAKALAGPVTIYDSQASNYKDGLYTETWMAQQCGIQEVSDLLPEHWR